MTLSIIVFSRNTLSQIIYIAAAAAAAAAAAFTVAYFGSFVGLSLNIELMNVEMFINAYSVLNV
jgi:hypothetical protein